MRLRGLIFALTLLAAPAAHAQSCTVQQSAPALSGGGNVFGFIAAQWKAFFAAKVDANNGTLCNPTILGTISITAQTIINALGYTPMTQTASNVTLPIALRNLGLQIPASCDGIHLGSGNITSGSANFFSDQANFTSADIGKKITVQGAGIAGVTLATTILSITDLHNVVLSTTASTSVGSAGYAYGSDYTGELQAAIDAGMPIHLPKGECGISATLNLKNNTVIQGFGADPYFPPPTSLLWLSASSTPMMSIDTGTLATGINLGGFALHGMCAASEGIDSHGLQTSVWLDIGVINTTDIGFHYDVSANGNFDTSSITMIKLSASVQNSCAPNMRGVVVEPGNDAHELTRSTFIDTYVLNMNGTAFDFFGLNSSVWYNTRAINVLGGTGASVDFHSAAVSPEHAHANVFLGFEASGTVYSRAGAFPAEHNAIYGWDDSTYPVSVSTESGASLQCQILSNQPVCSGWALYGNGLTLENSSGPAIVRSTNNTNGVIIYGGQTNNGANIELYGSGFGVPNSAFYDAASHSFRDQAGGTSYLTVDTANSQIIVNHNIVRGVTNDGIIISGGSGPTNGANIELYGSTAGAANAAFYDAGTHVFRNQTGGTSALVLDGANAHLRVGSSGAPVLTSCGTNPAISGTDIAGEVTMGTGAPTGCVITFAIAYVGVPYCTVTWEASPLVSQSYAVSTTAITLTQTATSSNKVAYHCIARNGG